MTQGRSMLNSLNFEENIFFNPVEGMLIFPITFNKADHRELISAR